MPNSDVFFGDYTNITAHAGIVRPIWTRLNNGSLSVWTDTTPSENFATSSNTLENKFLEFETFPNPTDKLVFVSYKLHEKCVVDLSIFDSKGVEITKIINSQQKSYGKYVERINVNDLRIPAGNYFLKLQIDGKIATTKLVVVP